MKSFVQSVSFPVPLQREITREAKKRGISFAAMVRLLCRDALRNVIKAKEE